MIWEVQDMLHMDLWSAVNAGESHGVRPWLWRKMSFLLSLACMVVADRLFLPLARAPIQPGYVPY